MSRTPVVLGVGLHPFGHWPDKSGADMVRAAATSALDQARVSFRQVDFVACGRVYRESGGGFEAISELGLTGVPITTTDMACASSAAAFREACRAIELGDADVALVVGFEKMVRGALQSNTAGTYDEMMGLGLNLQRYAFKARAYIDRFGASVEAFAQVSVKSHANAIHNPNAQYRNPLTLEDVLHSRMVADPLTLYQCCPTSDGAAAAVVCASDVAARYTNRGIRVSGWAIGTPSYDDLDGIEPLADLFDSVAQRVSKQAYERAGLGPEDVGVTQLHDAFTSGEIIRIEALGLCGEGQAADLTLRGETGIGGSIPVNTDGGLLSRGHPLGATGIAQIAEIFLQLNGEAGVRQVDGAPKVGLCHVSGGGATVGTVVHIFER